MSQKKHQKTNKQKPTPHTNHNWNFVYIFGLGNKLQKTTIIPKHSLLWRLRCILSGYRLVVHKHKKKWHLPWEAGAAWMSCAMAPDDATTFFPAALPTVELGVTGGVSGLVITIVPPGFPPKCVTLTWKYFKNARLNLHKNAGLNAKQKYMYWSTQVHQSVHRKTLKNIAQTKMVHFTVFPPGVWTKLAPAGVCPSTNVRTSPPSTDTARCSVTFCTCCVGAAAEVVAVPEVATDWALWRATARRVWWLDCPVCCGKMLPPVKEKKSVTCSELLCAKVHEYVKF